MVLILSELFNESCKAVRCLSGSFPVLDLKSERDLRMSTTSSEVKKTLWNFLEDSAAAAAAAATGVGFLERLGR